MNDEPSELMSDDDRIQAIFSAAEDCKYATDASRQYASRRLSDAIDAAMSHAYAEGRADERKENAKAGDTVKAIEDIWGLSPRRQHAA